MVVTITKDDIRKSKQFLDSSNCVLATALRRVTHKKRIEAKVTSCCAGRTYYKVDPIALNTLLYLQDSHGSSTKPNPSAIGLKFTLTKTTKENYIW